MYPRLNIAIRAIRKGGNFLAQNYDKKYIFDQNSKKNIKYLKNIQNITFNIISEIILKFYPTDTIIQEKIYHSLKTDQKMKWIIYPLDGKTNFLHKIPHFCVSILIIKNNIKLISVIYDPIKNDLFTAIKGKGAQLNGYRMRCSTQSLIYNSIITIYILKFLKIKKYLFFLSPLLQENTNIRCSGSLILDLAYLSSGKIDFFIGINLKKNNFLVGELQIQESGALISDFFGNPNYNIKNNIFSSNEKLLRFMLQKNFLESKEKK
ncbi:inositol monophosphatase family protein [Buchnera aphidicola]|uniref:inositol monophosphatase family protein n=1 Tax=Buchnera aphidicola TaxID=9 RepID=UPI00313CE678